MKASNRARAWRGSRGRLIPVVGVALTFTAVAGMLSPAAAHTKTWSGKIGAVYAGGVYPDVITPERAAFLAAGCNTDMTTGGSAALFKVVDYRGHRLIVRPGTADARIPLGSTPNRIDVYYSKACTPTDINTPPTLLGRATQTVSLTVTVPSTAVYIILRSALLEAVSMNFTASAGH